MLRSTNTVLSDFFDRVHFIDKIIFLSIAILFFLAGCASSKSRISKSISDSLVDKKTENYFTGILIFDPQNGDTLYNQNAKKYFTPASNTKIFTLYSSLKLLPEKIPTLKYLAKNDSLYFEGTGDPTLFHPYFQDSTAIDFLKDKKNIALCMNNFQDAKYGPGWSWDDYHYYYQVERVGFPLYGNVVTLFNFPDKTISPDIFRDSVIDLGFKINRESEKNRFYFSPRRKDTAEIPFRTDSTLTRKILERALGKKVKVIDRIPDGEKTILYSVSTDSVLKRMMHESDNFLAEQLLILASSTLSDTLSGQRTRKYVVDSLLRDLKQQPRWVDGSGLSRYNLFTPESMVQVLLKMYREIPLERLFDFFPEGGVSGTLEDWYPGNPEPYIIAKTGSLGNNHCLSGYLLTKSGKTLIFSFMNNHFRRPSSEIKMRMQRIFEEIRDTY